MEKNFLPHLNVQTNSNLSFSLIKIKKLIEFANEKKINCLAISDYYPYDLINFFSECKRKKIKAIWGTKIFIKENSEKKYSVVIYPKNKKGYKEIIQKLFSIDSPIDRIFQKEFIFSFSNENCLLIFEANNTEEIIHFNNDYIFPKIKNLNKNNNNFYIGFNFFLSSPSFSKNIYEFLIPFFSIKTFQKEENYILDLWKKTSYDKNFFSYDKNLKHIPYLDLLNFFFFCTDSRSFYESMKIKWENFIDKIDSNIFSFLKFKNNKKRENIKKIKDICWTKLHSLKKNPEEEEKYCNILEKELKIIEELNYEQYFLTFNEIVEHLKKKDILIGPGRGSSTSSLVAYLLKITSIDPLKNNLFFETFLNKKRKTLADIDLDVEKQEEVFNFLQEKYSKENKISKITIKKKIGLKNAYKKLGNIFEIKKEIIEEIIYDIDKKDNNLRTKRLIKKNKNFKDFYFFSEKIADLYYDKTTHPSGFIISEKSLKNFIPFFNSKNNLSFFKQEDFAHLNLKKYDFLSLNETLSIIRKIKKKNIKIPDYEKVDIEDKKTWWLLKNFLISGIFQIDTINSRLLFNKIKPQNFFELVMFIAINRPGNKEKLKEIIFNKNNNEEYKKNIEKINSKEIKEILEETYGVIIFKEQLSRIFSFIYDCSLEEAENKRRELEKNKFLEEIFFKKIEKKLSVYEKEKIIYQIKSTIEYTFSKSHAVSYGKLVYYIAYLKANFFSEIMLFFLNKNEIKKQSYIEEIFFCGFKIKNPDINYSEIIWIKKDEFFIVGFNSLKNFKNDFFSEIIKEREKNGKFENWEDFINRTSLFFEKIDKGDILKWINIDLFKSLKINKKDLENNLDNLFRYIKIIEKINLIKKINKEFIPFLDITYTQKKNYKLEDNSKENEILGFYIKYFFHWIDKKKEKKNYKIETFQNIFQNIKKINNKEIFINLYVIISKIEKKNQNFYLITFQDFRSSFKLFLEKNFWEKNKEILLIHNEVFVKIKVSVKNFLITSLTCLEIKE